MKLKNACSLEEKLWPTRQCIKKQRNYFASKGPSSQSYCFSSSHVWMWELDHKESWMQKKKRKKERKKSECWRINAFELRCWGRLLRVPWTARRSNQSILKEISPEYSLEELMLKLRYFGYLMRRTDSLEKTLMLGKIEGMRRRGWQRMRWMTSLTRWTWVWVSSGSWWWTGKPDMAVVHGGHKELNMTEQLNWIELMGSGVVSKVCLWKVLIRLKVTWETLVEMLLLLLTCFSCVWLCVTPQTPPSMGFFRQE